MTVWMIVGLQFVLKLANFLLQLLQLLFQCLDSLLRFRMLVAGLLWHGFS